MKKRSKKKKPPSQKQQKTKASSFKATIIVKNPAPRIKISCKKTSDTNEVNESKGV